MLLVNNIILLLLLLLLQLLLLLLLQLLLKNNFKNKEEMGILYTCSGAQPNHLEDLQDDGWEHGEDTAEASGDEAAGIKLCESTWDHSERVRETLHSTGKNFLQSTVNAAWNVNASLLCFKCPLNFISNCIGCYFNSICSLGRIQSLEVLADGNDGLEVCLGGHKRQKRAKNSRD